MTNRIIQGATRTINSLAAATSSRPGSGLLGRVVTSGIAQLPASARKIAERVYSTSPRLAQLGALGSAHPELLPELYNRLSASAELKRVHSAAQRAGITPPERPLAYANAMTTIESHKAATIIHVTTTPMNAREVADKIMSKSTPENPSSSVFESAIKGLPISAQTIKEKCRAINLAIKKETDELQGYLDAATKIRGEGPDKQSEATLLISSHLYDPSKGSISRFNTGNLLPVILGILFKAGEYDLVVRLVHDTDSSLITDDLPSMQMYVQALLRSQYTNIHLINATLDVLEEKFGPASEVLSLKGQFNRILADTAKLTLDIHHHDTAKYKDGSPETDKFLKAAEIERAIVFPTISPESQAALEATRNLHENIAIANYLYAYALGNNPKDGKEAILIMKGIVLREKMLLEQCPVGEKARLTRDIEQLEKKITETQRSVDQLLQARSPHAHYKGSIALSILEADLRLHPNDEKKFVTHARNLLQSCQSAHTIQNLMLQLGRHQKLFDTPKAQEKIQILLDILSIKLKDWKKDAGSSDRSVNLLFEKFPAASKEILKEEATITPFQELIERSIFYAHQTSSHIPENFSRGGLVSTQQIGSMDFKVFEELVAHHPINQLLPTSPDTRTLFEVKDPEEAIKIMQQIVRYRFNNASAELEIEISPEHQLMERRIRKEQELAGYSDKSEQKEAFDSHTSNVITYAKGLGDCRIHAQSMQMYFTSWKALQLDDVREKISALETASKKKRIGSQEIEKLKEKEIELNTLHLGTIQSDIYLSIQRIPDPTHPGWTQPKLDDKGRFILDVHQETDPVDPSGPSIVTVAPPKKNEEHVLTALFRTNPTTKEVDISLADAFYQNLYPLGSGPLMPLGKSSDEGFSAGTVKGLNPITGKEVDIPVILHLSSFAGDRSSKSTAGEGQVLLHGHLVDTNMQELVTACSTPRFTADYQKALDECK